MGNSLIEGIGDDLIYGLIVTIIAISPIVYFVHFLSQRRYHQHTIHPEYDQQVQQARDHLRERPPPTAPPETIVNDPHTRERQNDRDMTCPVCLMSAVFAVETNCGHIFCSTCMITYWKHGSWISTVKCPVCRQAVNILLMTFTQEEQNTDSILKNELIRDIRTYNKRFSGEPRSLMEILQDLPTLLRHCFNEVFSLSGLILMFRLRVILIMAFAVIYLISPLDIIPEAAFGILGFLDDFFILLLLAIYVSILYRRYLAAAE